ncbi:MAG: YqiA/YcfP family alpha/beta fold hydrolase [Succinivibrio sp.]|jgi:predicted esterase YcpF (UPF0227 family)|nr:YqiA/YcfP family alpha/beta fold hydrolase [Succinivibrio sp.]
MLIAYLHGFLSGPQALKRRVLENWLKENHPETDFDAPDYPDIPAEAIAALDAWAKERQSEHPCLVGSSMGGFMATVLQCRYGFKIALVNPCTHPQDYFPALCDIPQHNDFTGADFVLRPEMIETLRTLDSECARRDPQKTRVFLQKGDEVLDYRKSLAFYAACAPEVQEGGCHAFDNFAAILPKIYTFFAGC